MNELPTTAMGAIRLLANTQTSIDVMSDQLIQSVKEGESNPIEVLTILRAFKKVSERVEKEIAENVLTEASKYPENSFEVMGNKIEKAEFGVKYDYTICNDPVYVRRKDIADKADEQLKERESFLKALKQPMTMVDEESGEIVTIIPPTKTSTSGIKISIR